MAQPGAIGYVLINFDGIPVKALLPEPKANQQQMDPVQISALVSDLVMKTKRTLKELKEQDSEFGYLRMRTLQDTEFIVTDYVMPGSSNEYILVCIQ